MGPLPKLRLVIVEALDLHSKSLLIPLATFGHMCHSRRSWWREVRITAADIKETRALAILWVQNPKVVPYVNEASAICDDGTVVAALVIWNTFIVLTLIAGTIFEDFVNIDCCRA